MGDGHEETNDLLRNISSDEASEFDREWSQRAQRHFPQNHTNGIYIHTIFNIYNNNSFRENYI